MEMSNFEIVRSFKEAADKKAQLQVLADLNVCSVDKIRTILIQEGIPHQTLPRNRVKKSVSVDGDAPAAKRPYNRKSARTEQDDRRNRIIHDALCCYREHLTAEIDRITAAYNEEKKQREDTIREIDDLIVDSVQDP